MINDYIKSGSRGKGNAVYFQGNTAGKLISTMLLINLESKLTDKRIYYWVCAGLVALAGIATFVMMFRPLSPEIEETSKANDEET